ncbi:hypothetical protein AHAS_Ahas16G0202600 [Arachis hypogaea]
MVHKHMAGLVSNYKGVHHSHHLGMHHRMVVGYSALEGIVAKRVDQILVAPPIFDSSNLDVYFHYSFLFLQHNYNQTHSQRGERS